MCRIERGDGTLFMQMAHVMLSIRVNSARSIRPTMCGVGERDEAHGAITRMQSTWKRRNVCTEVDNQF